MIRTASTAFALIAVVCLTSLPAEARKKTKHDASPSADDADTGGASASKAKPDAASAPVKVASFGDWGAYLAKGKTKAKTCYTLGSPKERKPDGKREAAYVFIADRPADKVRNEVSIIMGFPMKEGSAAQAKVGTASFDLIAKGSNAWIKNPDDESKFVDALRHAGKLVVKAAPKHGPSTTDLYMLAGLKQALDRVTKDCK